ncbi:EAL domain-containing protein [Salisediminibacterium beveridgei]|uniref:Putative EAL-domain containing protein ykuI n=1 Tax=Salisediminibacterium beveridgei TaxID=632773 RepID=A0A1D7QVM0_9BACI|nr:EAL-associated domain-containing protein [Salisediminibacterium beveridgei]AOM83063.1 putative EAL-domain containing protein ykuI [Salisediminibacterium beveridgei]
MDPMKVMDHLDEVRPYFQPIFNTEEYRVIGYEVLARIELDGKVHSLAPFFLDDGTPSEYKWEVDQLIHERAVKEALQWESDTKLFFNLDLKTLLDLDCVEDLMEAFQRYDKEGLSPERVVFEFRVAGFEEERDVIHMFLYMKASGFRVSIDDIKLDDTNLDHFSKLEPTYLKIDLSDLRSGKDPNMYRDLLNALALFSRKIGATLHFSGIQEKYQLLNAWKYGGRYLQGFYLKMPMPDKVEPLDARPVLQSHIHSFIVARQTKLSKQIDFIKQIEKQLKQKGRPKQHESLLKELTHVLEDISFRMYISDDLGNQVSANWMKTHGNGWITDERARGKNWSWRTYFLDHIMQMKYRNVGMLSDKYRDIKTNEFIRTYSYPLDDDYYLFIDIDPTYLFEHDWLH